MEVANSRGLCVLQASAKGFSGPSIPSNGDDASDEDEDTNMRTRTRVGITIEQTESPREAEDVESKNRSHRVSKSRDENGGDDKRSQEGRGEQVKSPAVIAAMLISEGGKAGVTTAGGGSHLAQKVSNAILEGVAWSLAGRGNTDGVRASERRTEQVS